MKESDFQTKFNKWWRHNWPEYSTDRFELKFINLDKCKRLNYKSHIKEHQFAGLMNRDIYKIPDVGEGQKPFDAIGMGRDCEGYLVVQFWKPRVKVFYIINIKKIMKHKEDGNKSLTEDDARDLGKTCHLK